MEVLSVVEDFDVVEDGFSVGFTDGIVFTVHAFQLRFLHESSNALPTRRAALFSQYFI